MPRPDPSRRQPYRPGSASHLRDPLQIGLTIVGVTAAFGGAGWWLDARLGTFPILMAIGAVLGLFGIIYLTYKQLQAADKESNSGSRQPDERP